MLSINLISLAHSFPRSPSLSLFNLYIHLSFSPTLTLFANCCLSHLPSPFNHIVHLTWPKGFPIDKASLPFYLNYLPLPPPSINSLTTRHRFPVPFPLWVEVSNVSEPLPFVNVEENAAAECNCNCNCSRSWRRSRRWRRCGWLRAQLVSLLATKNGNRFAVCSATCGMWQLEGHESVQRHGRFLKKIHLLSLSSLKIFMRCCFIFALMSAILRFLLIMF